MNSDISSKSGYSKYTPIIWVGVTLLIIGILIYGADKLRNAYRKTDQSMISQNSGILSSETKEEKTARSDDLTSLESPASIKEANFLEAQNEGFNPNIAVARFSEDQCISTCNQNPNCVMYKFGKYSDRCEFKYATHSPGKLLGVKRDDGQIIKYYDKDILRFDTKKYPNATVNECRDHCQHDVNCNYYSFDTNTSECTLKTQDENVTESKDTTPAFYGINPNGTVFTKDMIGDTWSEPIKNSCCVKSIFKDKTGNIIAAGKDNNMYYKTDLEDPWKKINDSCCVTYITTDDAGIYYAIGTDGNIYTKQSLRGKWEGPAVNSQFTKEDGKGMINMISLTFDINTGYLLAVGKDNNVYTKQKIIDYWVLVENSCCVKHIMTAYNGKYYGVGTDQKIYQKDKLTDKWQGPIKNSCCVDYLTNMNV